MTVLYRSAIIIAIVLVTIAATVGIIWVFAYRAHKTPPRAQLHSLTAPAHVHIGTSGTIEVTADNMLDTIRSLGYAHATQHAWTMAVWRQAAQGQLSLWFGHDALAADRLARQLGFSRLAQESMAQLTSADRAFLKAYSDGVNAAWSRAKYKAEFLSLDVIPEPWESWHTLTIERLLAWFSQNVLEGCEPLLTLCLDDKVLRDMLHVHGFQHSSAWLKDIGERAVFYQRHILGASATPVYQEATLKIAGWLPIRGASIIGTPFFPAAYSDSSAWAILLNSPRSFTQPVTGPAQFEHITGSDGNEHLTIFTRLNGQLTIGSSNQALKWNGLNPGTDTGAWRALLERTPPEFTIQRGDGIHVNQNRHWRVSGNPLVQDTLQNGILIGNAPEAASLADYIEERTDSTLNVEFWLRDFRSTWAATVLPAMLESVQEGLETPPAVRSALAYLRNWDYAFQGYSIGSTIFTEWTRMQALDQDQEVTLTYAVERLTHRFGPNQSLWRWEHLHEDQRFFIIPSHLKSSSFVPIVWPGQGHSTTLVWGGTLTNGDPLPPASWEMWMDLSPSPPVYVRRRHIDLNIPLGRYIAEFGKSIVFGLPTASSHVITLHP